MNEDHGREEALRPGGGVEIHFQEIGGRVLLVDDVAVDRHLIGSRKAIDHGPVYSIEKCLERVLVRRLRSNIKGDQHGHSDEERQVASGFQVQMTALL